jgi:hypothetical protein
MRIQVMGASLISALSVLVGAHSHGWVIKMGLGFCGRRTAHAMMVSSPSSSSSPKHFV